MLTKTITFFALLLCSVLLYSQDCLPGGITFSTQLQIDNFAANYPGCSVIDGDVTLLEAVGEEINNLNGLAPLTAINGDLQIRATEGLLTLQGLHNLATVGGTLDISYNEGLSNLTGLTMLTSIGENFLLNNNDNLEHLTGLEAFLTVGEELQIFLNPDLQSLNGLDNLMTIGEAFILDRNVALTDISKLSKLTSVGGLFKLSGHTLLPNLDGLESLTTVGGNFSIEYNALLSDIMGLDGLTSIDGGLFIVGNDQLPNLDGLENLLSIEGELILNNNGALLELNGLRGLNSIGGNLMVLSNDLLVDITGLAAIDPLSIGLLFVRFNDQLTHCAALSICQFLDTPGSIAIISDNSDDCNSRAEVEDACMALLPVTWGRPLEAIQKEEDVQLSWSVVNQLANEHFKVEHSTDGKTFTAIASLAGEASSQEEQHYYFSHAFPSFGLNYYRIKQVDEDGSFSYSNLVSVYYKTAHNISVYPNPVSAYLYLRGVDPKGVSITITITNAIGKIMDHQAWSGEPLDFTNYPAGIYFLRLEQGDYQHVQKLIRKQEDH
jgi:hypothetical protein